MQHQPLPPGVERITNEGQGDCLYLSIAQGIKLSGGGDHHHRSVRAAATAHMRKHVQKYYLFWDRRNTDDTEAADKTVTGFETYISAVSQTGAWSGNLEIACLASTLDRPITVVHEQGQIFHFNPEGSRKDLFLYYSATVGHYECLKVPPDVQLSFRTKALPGQTKGGRKSGRGGMGHDSKSLGGHTRHTRISKSSLGGHTAKSRSGTAKQESLGGLTVETNVTKVNQESLGGHTRVVRQRTNNGAAGSSTKAPASHTEVEMDCEAEMTPAAASSSSAAPYHYQPQEMWTCPLCGFVIKQDPTKCPLYRRRRNHIDQRHPDQRNNKLFHMREYAKVVEATDKLHPDEVDWICVWCGKALPLLHKHLKGISITHHFKTKHPRRDTSAAASNKQRAKLARQGNPRAKIYLQGKKTLGQKLRTKYASSIPSDHGHEFKEFHATEKWPLKKHLLHRRDDVHLTCVKCRRIRFRGKIGKLGPCRGLCPPDHWAQRLWKKLQICPQTQRTICKIWGITLREADSWFDSNKSVMKRPRIRQGLKKPAARSKVWKRNLIEDGDIESNPGPNCLSLFTLNCNGVSNLWKVLKEVVITSEHRIFHLQDAQLTEHEFQNVSKFMFGHGFYSYHQPGGFHKDGYGHQVPRGGVVTIVPKGILCRYVWSQNMQHTQMLVIAAAGTWFINCYTPPGYDGLPHDELSQMFLDFMQSSHCSFVQPWIMSGDFNYSPPDAPALDVLKGFGGHVMNSDMPTRWQGKKELDWFCTNRPLLCGQVQKMNYAISDHIPLTITISLSHEDNQQGVLKAARDYSIPIDVSASHWQLRLHQWWEQSDRVSKLCSRLQGTIDVQGEWEEFNACLNDMCTEVMKKMLNESHPQTTLSQISTRLRVKRLKGNQAEHCFRPWNRKRAQVSLDTFYVRRQRNRLAKLQELKRQILLGEQKDIAVFWNLCKKLELESPTLKTVLHEIDTLRTSILKSDKAGKQSALTQWRKRLIEIPNAVGRWVRSKTSPMIFALTNDQGRISESLQEGAFYGLRVLEPILGTAFGFLP